jgi:FkbM family methyltransferase
MLKDLHTLLNFELLTHVVDVGANPIDGIPPYTALLNEGLCRVTGFEPQLDALATLNKKKSPNESYLPYAVGNGEIKTLNICRHSGWTSTLTPSAASLDVFTTYKPNAEILRRETIETKTLDSIAEIDAIDFLKIDIQGGELEAFKGATRHLADISVVQTEVSFVNFYDDQPSFGDIDVELRKHGFIPHCFAGMKKGIIAPFTINNNPWQSLNQLQEADVVYVKDFREPRRLSDAQLKHICLIALGCYGSFDLAYRCILALQERAILAKDAGEQYVTLLNGLMQTLQPPPNTQLSAP